MNGVDVFFCKVIKVHKKKLSYIFFFAFLPHLTYCEENSYENIKATLGNVVDIDMQFVGNFYYNMYYYIVYGC